MLGNRPKNHSLYSDSCSCDNNAILNKTSAPSKNIFKATHFKFLTQLSKWPWQIPTYHRIYMPFFVFPFISWRLITLQYCSGFCHTLKWISHGFTCIRHPNPPSHLPPHPSLWVFPVYQPWALVSCIQPGLVICFTLDNIHVLMLFSQNIPPSPSPPESKSLFCTSVSLFLFCI